MFYPVCLRKEWNRDWNVSACTRICRVGLYVQKTAVSLFTVFHDAFSGVASWHNVRASTRLFVGKAKPACLPAEHRYTLGDLPVPACTSLGTDVLLSTFGCCRVTLVLILSIFDGPAYRARRNLPWFHFWLQTIVIRSFLHRHDRPGGIQTHSCCHGCMRSD